jgi:hypothetical protein
MSNNLNILIIIATVIFIFGCGGETKTEELQRGRLKYIDYLRYGNAGTHGSKGWYSYDSEIKVKDWKWNPPGIDVHDKIADCEGSPDKSLEILKCTSFADSKETIYILKMKNDEPVWETASTGESVDSRGNNSGEWVNDGKSLFFKDYFFDVQTSEKQEIKGLPDYPSNYYRAASPDLETIVYEGFCFNNYVKVPVEVARTRNKTCDESEDYIQKKQILLWIINIKTGETKFLALNREKYDWVLWNQEKFHSKDDWLTFFRQQLVWEKGKEGKYQLVFPITEESPKKK